MARIWRAWSMFADIWCGVVITRLIWNHSPDVVERWLFSVLLALMFLKEFLNDTLRR